LPEKSLAKAKKECKRRAAELYDEALFKDPPAKEDCPICFLPMPMKLICCLSLPPATVSSVPIYDFAVDKEDMGMEAYYPCCGKSICRGCEYSFYESEKIDTCQFCKAERIGTVDTEGKSVEYQLRLMKRVEANDAGAMCVLAHNYHYGERGLQQDWAKALELYARAAEFGSSQAHFFMGIIYRQEGDLKKAKFHYEAAAMAGHEDARCKIGVMEYESWRHGGMEYQSGHLERAVKHLRIAASVGDHGAMHTLRTFFEAGVVSRVSIDSTLIAYNNSCTEMRSEARDTYISVFIDPYGFSEHNPIYNHKVHLSDFAL